MIVHLGFHRWLFGSRFENIVVIRLVQAFSFPALRGSYRVIQIGSLDHVWSDDAGYVWVHDSSPINIVGISRHFHLLHFHLLQLNLSSTVQLILIQVIMAPVNLSSSEESSGRGRRGYDNGASSSAMCYFSVVIIPLLYFFLYFGFFTL